MPKRCFTMSFPESFCHASSPFDTYEHHCKNQQTRLAVRQLFLLIRMNHVVGYSYNYLSQYFNLIILTVENKNYVFRPYCQTSKKHSGKISQQNYYCRLSLNLPINFYLCFYSFFLKNLGSRNQYDIRILWESFY